MLENIEEQGRKKELDPAQTALIFAIYAPSSNVRDYIEHLLTSVSFAVEAALQNHRSDLLKEINELRTELYEYLLYNWEWLQEHQADLYLPAEARRDLIELFKIRAKIVRIREKILRLAISMQGGRVSSDVLPTLSYKEGGE